MGPWKERLQVIAGVSAIVGLACYNVLGPKTAARPGHDLASNEKPEALRKETPRNLEIERAKVQAAAAARPTASPQ
jgi:hypothetical protein